MRFGSAAAALVSVAAALLVSGALPARREPLLMLWVWERPERLDFIDPREAGVAYLDRTVLLRGEAVIVRPRLQPLRLPPHTRVSAVVRVETDAPRQSSSQRVGAVAALLEAARRPDVAGLQIDFDATRSERAFYGELLRELRAGLPSGLPLSITALASWCLDDPWIPPRWVEEAVPMLFRMGPEAGRVARRLRAGPDFSVEACRQNYGVSTDEPLPPLRAGRRVYVFHPRPWSRAAYENVMRQVRSWQ